MEIISVSWLIISQKKPTSPSRSRRFSRQALEMRETSPLRPSKTFILNFKLRSACGLFAQAFTAC
jgi:hypothetical protein